jgi:hypothetical protein
MAPTPRTVALHVRKPGCLSPLLDYSRASSCAAWTQLLHVTDLTTIGSFSIRTRRSMQFWQALEALVLASVAGILPGPRGIKDGYTRAG